MKGSINARPSALNASTCAQINAVASYLHHLRALRRLKFIRNLIARFIFLIVVLAIILTIWFPITVHNHQAFFNEWNAYLSSGRIDVTSSVKEYHTILIPTDEPECYDAYCYLTFTDADLSAISGIIQRSDSNADITALCRVHHSTIIIFKVDRNFIRTFTSSSDADISIWGTKPVRITATPSNQIIRFVQEASLFYHARSTLETYIYLALSVISMILAAVFIRVNLSRRIAAHESYLLRLEMPDSPDDNPDHNHDDKDPTVPTDDEPTHPADIF